MRTGLSRIVLLAMITGTTARADLIGSLIDDHTDQIAGVPAGCRVFRAYLLFDEPTDILLAVGPFDQPGPIISFSTDCSGGLFNDGGPLDGLKAEDFPGAPIAPEHDSWITIGASTAAENDTNYPLRFLDGNGVDNVVTGSSWSDDDAGWFDGNPGTPVTPDAQGRILIAQFTVCDECCSIQLSGCAKWKPQGGNVLPTFFDSVTAVPCPAGGACCTDSGCVFDDVAGCTAIGGTFLGVGTVCDGPSCPGACCLPDGTCEIRSVSDCDLGGGVYLGDSTSCEIAVCPAAPLCPADVDGNLAVDFDDLLGVLSNWGACLPLCPYDIDGSGAVDFGDLIAVLSHWGPCETAPTGACCLVDESCVVGTLFDCIANAGFYQGDGTGCASTLCAPDCNANSISDTIDIAGGSSDDCNLDGVPDECQDCDGNGIADPCDIDNGAVDCNVNGVPDVCELDCDGNGVPDDCDIQNGTLLDCNGDGRPDSCFLNGYDNELDSADCNTNGIPDECDIANGDEADCNLDGTPDSCQDDCNVNGVPDDCDLSTFGGSADCNGNGVPDECESDCNVNGIPDDCDIASGVSDDLNDNGIPDTCDINSGSSFDSPPNGIPDDAEPPIVVSPADYFASSATTVAGPAPGSFSFIATPIPAGFFDPGSAPFDGEIFLAGKPIAPNILFAVNAIVERSADPFLLTDPPGPGTATVDIEIVALNLVTIEPITVVIDGVDTLWSAEVRLSSQPQVNGTLTAVKTHANGGTFDSLLPVLPRFAFHRVGDPGEVRILDYGEQLLLPVVFEVSGTPWVHVVDPDLWLVTDPGSDFAAGVIEDPRSNEQSISELDWDELFAEFFVEPASDVLIDLDIWNGLAGACGTSAICGGQPIGDEMEVVRGAVTVANLNDTNGDGTVDRNQNPVVANNALGRDEHDLMQIVLRTPIPDLGGTVELVLVSGDVKVWTTATKGAVVTLPATYATSELEKILWVEARSVSGSLRDISLELQYMGRKDTVAATGAWAEHSLTRHTNATSGVENTIPDDAGPHIVGGADAVANERAVDGSNFGSAPFRRIGSGATARNEITGGRILIEFTTMPTGVEALGVRWDITRQKKRRVRQIIAGTGVPSTPAGTRFADLDFPDDPANGKDNETPTDDNGSRDEDNTPLNQHIYSFDTPAVDHASSVKVGGALSDYYIRRYHFKEWVRARISIPGKESQGRFRNQDGKVEGSRASEKFDWRFIDYLRHNANNFWVFDGASPSVSAPRLTTGAPRGTAVATVAARAGTEGFSAVYDHATQRWTLTSTTGPSVVSASVAGGPWMLSLADKVSLTITQTGGGAFTPGSTFRFSTFRSTAAGGKQNVIEPGVPSFTTGP